MRTRQKQCVATDTWRSLGNTETVWTIRGPLSDPGFKLGMRQREKFFSDLLISGRSFKLGFTFAYMFYTFKPLPQLKIGRSLSL